MLTHLKIDGDSNDDSVKKEKHEKTFLMPKSWPDLIEKLLLTNVCFCCQVEDQINIITAKNVANQPGVTDISLMKKAEVSAPTADYCKNTLTG